MNDTLQNAKRAGSALLLSALLLVSFAACEKAAVPESSAVSASEPARNRTIHISKDTLRRTGVDIALTAHRLGLTNVTTNDDASCTIQMTDAEYESVCSTLKESLTAQMDALPESGTWPFLSRVSLSEDYRSAVLYAHHESYRPERDDAAAQAVYIPVLLYTAFTGSDAETFSMHFTVTDEETHSVLSEFDYPETDAVSDPESSDSGSETGTLETSETP